MSKEAEEFREMAKRKAEEAKAKKEAERQAKEQAGRDAEEAKERAKREAEEAKRVEEAEAKAKKEAGQPAKEQAVSAELYEGMVNLVIASPVDLGQMRRLEEYLCQVQDLRLVVVGGSVDEGTKIVVSAEKPIPLIDIIRKMPPIEQVVKKGKEIQVMLKARQ